jgi:hypothetical protein
VKVLITGGRSYVDRATVFRELDALHAETTITVLIHGAATGADSLADAWSKSRGVEVIACPADWSRHGRAAGPIRNKAMLTDHAPELLVAFPGGRGTANMISQARAAGLKIIVIGEQGAD